MILKSKKFGMIIADNYRSRIYLQQLVINRLIPNIILILSDKKVDASKVEIKNKFNRTLHFDI